MLKNHRFKGKWENGSGVIVFPLPLKSAFLDAKMEKGKCLNSMCPASLHKGIGCSKYKYQRTHHSCADRHGTVAVRF